MEKWTIAGVQMNPHFADKKHNLDQIRGLLREASRQAKLIIFPECALTGYCFDSKEEAWPYAEELPGPSTQTIANDCRELGVWAVVGMLESVPSTDQMFNTAVLIGPEGVVATYRKIHLPFLGVDRFTAPGDRPFAVHDVGGLRIGMTICYDGSIPEASRILMLQGADLIVLPTNWPERALKVAELLVRSRALENQVFFAAVNRVGEERGFRFIGRSQLVDCNGDMLAERGSEPGIIYAEIEPGRARKKEIVNIPGEYVLHRTDDRRPDMYGPLCEPRGEK